MNRPDAHELLSTAREVLMDKLFPVLPDDLHYEVRMIASAMGIAAREASEGHAAKSAEIALLADLVPGGGETGSLPELRADVARAIREGHFDEPGSQRQQAESAILALTLNALSISNPKVARAARDPAR